MGIFSSKKVDLPQEIDSLSQTEKVLTVREKYIQQTHFYWLLFLFSLSSCLSIYFPMKNIYVTVSWIAFSVFFLYLPISRKMIRRKILRTQQKKEEKTKQLLDSMKNTQAFISTMKTKEEETAEIADFSNISPLCILWDRLTHSYQFNKNALICPYCKAHNGLHDPNQPVEYICPNCKRTVSKVSESKKHD